MSLLNLFGLRKSYSKQEITTIVAITFLDFEALIDLDGKTAEVIGKYTECLNKIRTNVPKMGGQISEIDVNFILLFFSEQAIRNHAKLACRTALNIHQFAKELNHQYSIEGFPNLRLSAGIHTGQVTVTNELTNNRSNFRVLGNNVIVAKKVMRECDKDNEEILISEETIRRLNDGAFFIDKKYIDASSPKQGREFSKIKPYKFKDMENACSTFTAHIA